MVMALSNSKFIQFLTGPKLVFWLLPWLMVLLVIGTISQRYIGLFEAEKLFFASWWVWIGPVPMPGLYPMLGLFALGLTAKLLFKYKWNRTQAGSILTHVGVLLLLVGGLVTGLTEQEGYLTLMEGETGQTVSDYHARELTIFTDDKLTHRIPFEELDEGEVDGLPFDFTVLMSCRNCMPVMEDSLSLKAEELEKDDEANLSGVVFTVGDEEHVLFEAIPKAVEFENYKLYLQKERRLLPFKVQLNHFKKYVHQGSDIASEYESDVTVKESSGLEWSQTIRMNEPLRTQGYTLYQSSFIEMNGRQASVIAVVKNSGFLFPYIASIIMALGLILQTISRFKRVKL